jgi:hypothetical protein
MSKFLSGGVYLECKQIRERNERARMHALQDLREPMVTYNGRVENGRGGRTGRGDTHVLLEVMFWRRLDCNAGIAGGASTAAI